MVWTRSVIAMPELDDASRGMMWYSWIFDYTDCVCVMATRSWPSTNLRIMTLKSPVLMLFMINTYVEARSCTLSELNALQPFSRRLWIGYKLSQLFLTARGCLHFAIASAPIWATHRRSYTKENETQWRRVNRKSRSYHVEVISGCNFARFPCIDRAKAESRKGWADGVPCFTLCTRLGKFNSALCLIDIISCERSNGQFAE